MSQVAYAWRDEAEKEGARGAKLPKGRHRVQITRIVYEGKEGPFVSKGNDPQIMLIFEDRQARETNQMVTLSHKAGWTLAKLLGCCDPPANLSRLEADGIEPQHFADPEFADANLVGRQLTIDLDFENRDGKLWPLVTPVKVQGADAGAPPNTDDVPPAATDDEPPPAVDDDPPPSAGMTKEEAWASVIDSWSAAVRTDESAKARRNNAWTTEIKRIGKPEKDFSPADWAEVAEKASIPF